MPEIVSRGKMHNALSLPGFIARQNGRPVGLVTYSIENNNCEIITMNSLEQGRGIGSQLLQIVIDTARNKRCKRVWLIATNDNTTAQEFYKRKGFSIVAVHKNAIEQSRKLKPEIPLIGQNGIPIKDEIEMEFRFH